MLDKDYWYVSAYKLSDPVLLKTISDHYDRLLTETRNDPTLTTSEREQEFFLIMEDRALCTDWYVWDNCDRSRTFENQDDARAYYEKCLTTTSYTNVHLLSPEEFFEAMANDEMDKRVFLLKKFLLTMKDGPLPSYRVV